MQADNSDTRGADRQALGTIAAFCVARLLFAYGLGLGADESYTLAISRTLSLSYFDHPPLHQWIAHSAEFAFGEGIPARWPFILMFAATGWLAYRLTLKLFGALAALVALFALNVTPFFFASAGTWVVPDGPLLLALAGAALALADLFFPGPHEDPSPWRQWLLAGAALGLAGLSKYSAALSALGVVAFVALAPSQRGWFRHPAPYAAASLALALITPVIVWNASHGWASFVFQGSRGEAGLGLKPLQFVAMAAGEIALLSPWIFAPLVAGLISGWRQRIDERKLFLLCLALPPIVIFTLTPLWGARGFPHWTMPGWFFVYPLMGAWVTARQTSTLALRRWALATSALLALIICVVVVEARTGFPLRFAPSLTAKGDPTLEAFDWSGLKEAPLLQPPPPFVLSTSWRDAGKIALALGPAVPVYVASLDPRGFAFVDDGRRFVGRDGVMIARAADLENAQVAARLVFKETGEPQTFVLTRLGAPAVDVVLIPGKVLTTELPIPYPGAPGH